MSTRLPFISFIFITMGLTGCGSGTQPTEASRTVDSPLPVAHVDADTAGSISGKVTFTGVAPVMPDLDMASNPNCERQHKTPQKAETVVVNRNKTLKYVYVWIKEGLPKARWKTPDAPAQLAQTGCVYGPHVIGIMQGQQLEILNNDPVNHNVHAESRINPAWNESQPPRAEHKFKVFNAAEDMFPMTCSVHPWMRSWVAVSPHPFFAVTGDDGSFKLTGVPPGTYTIEAVHEQFGRKEARLTIALHGAATVDFDYAN